MWKETIKNLGELKVGKEQTITFEYEGPIIINRNRWGKPDIQTSCGCTSAVFKGNCLTVKYTPNPIPKHLIAEGKTFYNTRKTIAIGYIDSNGESKRDTLSFTALIKP